MYCATGYKTWIFKNIGIYILQAYIKISNTSYVECWLNHVIYGYMHTLVWKYIPIFQIVYNTWFDSQIVMTSHYLLPKSQNGSK